jgi:hypothetical protein
MMVFRIAHSSASMPMDLSSMNFNVQMMHRANLNPAMSCLVRTGITMTGVTAVSYVVVVPKPAPPTVVSLTMILSGGVHL